MTNHIPQPGDRYKLKNNVFTIEYIDDGKYVCIDNTKGSTYVPIGEILDTKQSFIRIQLDNYDYIGNFNKMSNFDALYNLLNS